MPKFSIIIPVYNVAPYLRECLDSVLAQTFADWEAICVDDGSKDGSGSILDAYATMDVRIRVLHQENLGVCAARNTALDMARGEWVCFVDGDDYLSDKWLAGVFNAINLGDGTIDFIRTGCVCVSDAGNRQVVGADNPHLIRCDQIVPVLWREISNCGYLVVNFMRRSLIGKNRFCVGLKFREDAVFAFSTATRSKCLLITDETGYNYRMMRQGSATSKGHGIGDTRKLLSAYMEVWNQIADKVVRRACREHSTNWIEKDLRESLLSRNDARTRDVVALWCLIWRLVFLGAFNPFSRCSALNMVRRIGFLLTACRIFYSVNRSLIGRIHG